MFLFIVVSNNSYQHTPTFQLSANILEVSKDWKEAKDRRTRRHARTNPNWRQCPSQHEPNSIDSIVRAPDQTGQETREWSFWNSLCRNLLPEKQQKGHEVPSCHKGVPDKSIPIWRDARRSNEHVPIETQKPASDHRVLHARRRIEDSHDLPATGKLAELLEDAQGELGGERADAVLFADRCGNEVFVRAKSSP